MARENEPSSTMESGEIGWLRLELLPLLAHWLLQLLLFRLSSHDLLASVRRHSSDSCFKLLSERWLALELFTCLLTALPDVLPFCRSDLWVTS
ncbi:MAG: hypothetical protein ACOYKZ_07565, partial [Chlamydiia bacterium]